MQRWRRNKWGTAATLNNLGIVIADLGRYPEAQAFHEESLAIQRELGSAQDIAISLNNLGCVAQAQGRYTEARAYFEESLAIQRVRGDRYRIAHALGNLGTQAYVQGDFDQAETCYRECLDIQIQLGDSQGIALTTLNLGEVARAQGAYGEALAKAHESLTMFRTLGEPTRIVSVLALLAATDYALGDVQPARNDLHDILDWSRGLTSHRAAHQWALVLARLACNEGLDLRAVQFLAAAEPQRTAHGATWTPSEQHDYDVCVVQLRMRVTTPVFQAAHADASVWSWSDLRDNALACLVPYGKR